MADFRNFQPRGNDGKYKPYKFLIKIIKGIIDSCRKKKNYKLKS